MYRKALKLSTFYLPLYSFLLLVPPMVLFLRSLRLDLLVLCLLGSVFLSDPRKSLWSLHAPSCSQPFSLFCYRCNHVSSGPSHFLLGLLNNPVSSSSPVRKSHESSLKYCFLSMCHAPLKITDAAHCSQNKD